jgi:NitT/TauT family transport system ATP-binding protein
VQTLTAERTEIAVEGVVRVLGGRRVLDGVDLRVPEHGRVGIVGRSGSGKSTLLSLIAGLDAPDAGSISVGLADCALMPQRDCLLPWRSALDNACLALENRGLPRAEARRRALPLFERLGLAGSEQLPPAKLSGGMRQRVAFARTLLADKEVLLLDEPFGALDAITRSELQQWLSSALAHEPRTVLLVTHDVEEALLLCDRVLVLSNGRFTAEVDVDVPRVISDPGFVELREQLLEAIA